MRVLVCNLPLNIRREIEALGVEAVEVKDYVIEAAPPFPDLPPEAFAIHRDEPAPNRAAVIPPHLLRRPKR